VLQAVIAGFGHNGEVALSLLDHLASLGPSTVRLSKFAGRLPVLLRVIVFDVEKTTRRGAERAVTWINWTRSIGSGPGMD